MHMDVKYFGCVILLFCMLARGDGAPVTGLGSQNAFPDITQPSPLRDGCNQTDFYFDTINNRCKPCLTCQKGWGSTANNCGGGRYGQRAKCEECMERETYQSEDSSKDGCKRCTPCDPNAETSTNCTTTQDTVCGSCKSGYGYGHPNHPNLCSRCKLYNHDQQPPECLTTLMLTSQESPTAESAESATQLPVPNSTIGVDGGSTAPLPLDETTTPIATGTVGPLGNDGPPRLLHLLWIILILGIPGVTSFIFYIKIWPIIKKRRCSNENGHISEHELNSLNAEAAPMLTAQSPVNPVNTIIIGSSPPSESGRRHSLEQRLPSQDDKSKSNSHNLQNGGSHVDGTIDDTRPTSCVMQVDTSSDSSPDADPSRQPPLSRLPTPEEGDSESTSYIQSRSNSPRPIVDVIQEETTAEDGSPFEGTPSLDVSMIKQDSSTQHTSANVGLPSTTQSTNKSGPGFLRSISLPATNSGTNFAGSSPILSNKQREKCIEKNKEKEVSEYQIAFNEASSRGSKIHWIDMDVKHRSTIECMLRPSDNELAILSYRDLGEQLGLDRNKELKACKTLGDVFDTLATRTIRMITMEEVLLAVQNIGRIDVVRMICCEINTKKPICHCHSKG